MRVGLLGGTFDPVHIGHLLLGETARVQLQLERVLFIPSGQPWRKAGRAVTSAVQRLEMLRLALQDDPWFETTDIEVAREGPSYTVDTLETLQRTMPDARFFLVLGQDALADLPNWHKPQEISRLATLAVARRPGPHDDPATLSPSPSGETEGEDASNVSVAGGIVWLEMPEIAISGSYIRQRVRDGLSIRFQIPAAVGRYISEHNLYSA